MDLTIIIPTYNRNEVFYKNFRELIKVAENIDARIEIIVVNDFKADKGKLIIPKVPDIKILENPSQGVSSARNLGAKHATSPDLLFMDDDIQVNEKAIREVLNFFQSSTANTVLNCDWVYPPELTSICKTSPFGRYIINKKLNHLRGWMGSGSLWAPDSIIEAHRAASYFLAIRKSTLVEIGGYNEKFPYAGLEDGEFADRLYSMGVKTVLNTKFKVFHNEFDRLSLDVWLMRKEREGITRQVSVSLGNLEYHIEPGSLKKFIFSFFYNHRNKIIHLIQNSNKTPDIFTHYLIRILEGSHIYNGYSTNL